MSFTGPLAYAAVFFSAIVEGEVVFIGASVLVAAGKLDPLAVLLFGALAIGLPPVEGVTSEVEVIRGVDGNDITLFIHRPQDVEAALRGSGAPSDDAGLRALGSGRVTLGTLHTIGGNPMRFTNGETAVRADEALGGGVATADDLSDERVS